ncbi:hypothetical protein Trydic_g17852 [Trypoxylus dichotomus]
MLALFDTYENDLSLADIIQHFLKTQLNFYDNLPKRICQECATHLIQFYNFSVVFEENNKKLQSLANNTIDLSAHISVTPGLGDMTSHNAALWC